MIVTETEFGAFLDREGVSGFSGWTPTEKLEALRQAEEWLLETTCRDFTIHTTTYYLTGNGGQTLAIPDALAITEVKIGDSAITDHVVLPLNGVPKVKLWRPSAEWTVPSDGTPGNVSVTGQWGYSNPVPARVQRAVCLMAAMSSGGGQLIPNPAQTALKSASAFNLSYVFSSAMDRSQAVVAVQQEARREIEQYIDYTARRIRALELGS